MSNRDRALHHWLNPLVKPLSSDSSYAVITNVPGVPSDLAMLAVEQTPESWRARYVILSQDEDLATLGAFPTIEVRADGAEAKNQDEGREETGYPQVPENARTQKC